MIRVSVCMRGRHEPLKRVPVVIQWDADGSRSQSQTDRNGVAEFDLPGASGKVIVSGSARYHGYLDGDIRLELWSLTEADAVADTGSPGGSKGGSTAYPGMQTRVLQVGERQVMTDSEGYLVDLDDWSEAFVRSEAAAEGLSLTSEHWAVVRFLRDYYEQHHVQASVRDTIRHFRGLWGGDKGNNRYLHDLFPRGGPQKQGNRLAGLLRTKGEH